MNGKELLFRGFPLKKHCGRIFLRRKQQRRIILLRRARLFRPRLRSLRPVPTRLRSEPQRRHPRLLPHVLGTSHRQSRSSHVGRALSFRHTRLRHHLFYWVLIGVCFLPELRDLPKTSERRLGVSYRLILRNRCPFHSLIPARCVRTARPCVHHRGACGCHARSSEPGRA